MRWAADGYGGRQRMATKPLGSRRSERDEFNGGDDVVIGVSKREIETTNSLGGQI